MNRQVDVSYPVPESYYIQKAKRQRWLELVFYFGLQAFCLWGIAQI